MNCLVEEEKTTKRKRKPWTARNKMMDLLAFRDHSEKELRQKLKQREFSKEEIDKALDFARDHQWLPANIEESEKLSERMAIGLHKKRKGINYINHFLKGKGLPPLKADPELEIEKALACIENKKSYDRMKLSRFLAGRGFSLETISKTLRKVTK